jgi:hypothetical protein
LPWRSTSPAIHSALFLEGADLQLQVLLDVFVGELVDGALGERGVGRVVDHVHELAAANPVHGQPARQRVGMIGRVESA